MKNMNKYMLLYKKSFIDKKTQDTINNELFKQNIY